MSDESITRTFPNPLRIPLLLAAGVIAVYGYHHWVGGTGGLDPARMGEESDSISLYSRSIHWFFIQFMGLPTIVLFVFALVVGTIRTGASNAEAGLQYALGSSHPEWMPGASLFLSVCAQVTAWGGVFLGIAGCLLMEITTYRILQFGIEIDCDLHTYLYWKARFWAEFAPLTGIVLGRIVFGALAEGARIRSGEVASPLFSRIQDIVLFGLLAIPWYLHCFFTRDHW